MITQKTVNNQLVREGGACDTPPNSHCMVCHIDTITGIAKVPDVDSLLNYLFASMQYVTLEYKKNYNGAICDRIAKDLNNLIIVEYGLQGNPEYNGVCYYYARITINGKFSESIKFIDYLRMCYILRYQFNMKCTRIDLTFDDYEKKITVSDLKAITYDLENPTEHMTGFKQCEFIGKNTKDNKTETLYLGSRKSKKLVRIYDTLNTHDYDALRFELQLRDDWAQQVYNFLMVKLEEVELENNYEIIMSNEIKTIIFNLFDFIIRTDKNIDRCERLPLWQQYRDYINCMDAHIPAPKPIITVQSRLEWLFRQVGKTLSMIELSRAIPITNAWFQELIKASMKRFTNVDCKWAEEFIKYFQNLTTINISF